jgi:tetraacyldisaccharide 4'-kinase
VAHNRTERLERYFLSVIQGERRTLGARFWRVALRHLSYLYEAAVRLRYILYRKRILRPHTLGCQVISVGNLTVGGTGKTPVVEVFARALQRQGRKVAILSRGYKKVEHRFSKKLMDKLTGRERRRPPRVVSDGRRLLLDSAMSGDEPYMLASNLPEVVILVDKDRVKSGRLAIDRFGCDTLLLDDGFQYLRLRHRVEVVLVDCTHPFSNGYVLPRGLLREPIAHIRRADFVFLTKSDGRTSGELKETIRRLNPRAEISECVHRARHLQNVYTGARRSLEDLRGARVAVVSGIASPEGFENQVAALGAHLVLTRRFVDHHRYSQQEIIDLVNAARGEAADLIVTTEKDAVRFPKLERQDVPLFFLRVEIELLSGAEDFHACISRICFQT